MEHPLATQAEEALTDDDFEREPGYCQRFVRQVRQAVYGHQYDQYDASSAKESAALWRHSSLAVDPEQGSQVGDILYFEHGHGPNGHVVIRIPGNLVAENSIAHNTPHHRGKGTRKLWQLGTPSLIVRLPAIVTRR